jgi:hypothetical protein
MKIPNSCILFTVSDSVLWYNGDGMTARVVNAIPLKVFRTVATMVPGKHYADWHRPSITAMLKRRDPRHWKAV